MASLDEEVFDDTTCPMCRKDIPILTIAHHSIQCACKLLRKSGLKPPCTCDTCDGVMVHQDPPSTPESSRSSSSRRSPKSLPTPLPNPDIIDEQPNIAQLQGEICFACGRSKNILKGVLKIGGWRTCKFCKLGELKEEETRLIVSKWFDLEVKHCRENRDPRPTWVRVASEFDDVPEGIQRGKKCSGYKNNTCREKCNKDTDSVICFTDKDGNESFFCAAVHFMRWYIKHMAGKRKKTNKKEKERDYISNVMNSPPDIFDYHMGFPKEVFERLVFALRNHQKKRKLGAPNSLTPLKQAFIYFTHLRHYLRQTMLSLLFNTSQSTISRTLENLNIFYFEYLSPLVTLGTYQSRLTESFQFFNDQITFILDGTEQRIRASSDVLLKGMIYSAKKKQHSITLLLIISPTGRALYISPCMFGSIVDNELVQRSQHEWEKEFENDKGFGDLGFRGLLHHNIFTPTHNVHSPLYKEFSSKRIKVEMKIADFKNWESLHAELRECYLEKEKEFLTSQSMRWKVVGSLENARMDKWQPLMNLAI